MKGNYWGKSKAAAATAEVQGYDAGRALDFGASYRGGARGRSLKAALEAFERGFQRGLREADEADEADDTRSPE